MVTATSRGVLSLRIVNAISATSFIPSPFGVNGFGTISTFPTISSFRDTDTVIPRLDVRYVASPLSTCCHASGDALFPMDARKTVPLRKISEWNRIRISSASPILIASGRTTSTELVPSPNTCNVFLDESENPPCSPSPNVSSLRSGKSSSRPRLNPTNAISTPGGDTSRIRSKPGFEGSNVGRRNSANSAGRPGVRFRSGEISPTTLRATGEAKLSVIRSNSGNRSGTSESNRASIIAYFLGLGDAISSPEAM